MNDYRNGVLNVVDIQTKLQSFMIKQVLQLIKGTKAKWKYLAVYWIGLHLRKYVPSFASLLIPHSERIPSYYVKALNLFRAFVQRVPNFMERENVTVKFIYHNMLESRCIPPRVLTIHPTINFSETWKWVQCHFVDPKYRDLAWRIAHHLYKFNITRNSKCYLCKLSTESLTHLFYDCSVLHGLWSFVASVLLDLTGCQVKISLNAILFNILKPHTVSHYNDLLMLLINLVKFCIWTLRNQAKHEFLKVTHICIKTMFIRTLRLRIKADFARFDTSTFCKYWCRNNHIAYVEGEALHIPLRLHPP